MARRTYAMTLRFRPAEIELIRSAAEVVGEYPTRLIREAALDRAREALRLARVAEELEADG